MADSSFSKPARTAGSNSQPSSVSSTRRPLRRNSGTWMYDSSALICWLTAAGVTLSASAAAEKLK